MPEGTGGIKALHGEGGGRRGHGWKGGSFAKWPQALLLGAIAEKEIIQQSNEEGDPSKNIPADSPAGPGEALKNEWDQGA
jgi:hypothetical protein